MRSLFVAGVILLLGIVSAQASGRHHYRHHHTVSHHHRHHIHRRHAKVRHHRRHVSRSYAAPLAWGLVTVKTAAGHQITVASHLSARFQAMIADFVAAGYRPRNVGCFARGGHVTHSRHYAGAACDFDQTGWGRTARFMYSREADAIIRRHGFRNGCTFSDCGHVDDGLPLHRHRW